MSDAATVDFQQLEVEVLSCKFEIVLTHSPLMIWFLRGDLA